MEGKVCVVAKISMSLGVLKYILHQMVCVYVCVWNESVGDSYRPQQETGELKRIRTEVPLLTSLTARPNRLTLGTRRVKYRYTLHFRHTRRHRCTQA